MAFTLRDFVCWASFAVSVAACAASPHPAPAYPMTMSAADEAAAIERAKQSPIAQPRVRPLYPEEAPPPSPIAESAPPTSALVARFEEASRASRSEPESTDFDFGDSYAAPGYVASPAYGWGVGVGLWPGYYGWDRPFGYRTGWRSRSSSYGAHYHGDYASHGGHFGGGFSHSHGSHHGHR
jgi:hypothetical protein